MGKVGVIENSQKFMFLSIGFLTASLLINCGKTSRMQVEGQNASIAPFIPQSAEMSAENQVLTQYKQLSEDYLEEKIEITFCPPSAQKDCNLDRQSFHLNESLSSLLQDPNLDLVFTIVGMPTSGELYLGEQKLSLDLEEKQRTFSINQIDPSRIRYIQGEDFIKNHSIILKTNLVRYTPASTLSLFSTERPHHIIRSGQAIIKINHGEDPVGKKIAAIDKKENMLESDFPTQSETITPLTPASPTPVPEKIKSLLADPSTIDKDQDGATGDLDCNDSDPKIFPDAEEICDLIDQNCNKDIIEGFSNLDQDAFPDCADSDIDGDQIANELDQCPQGYTGWHSSDFTDENKDGCHDYADLNPTISYSKNPFKAFNFDKININSNTIYVSGVSSEEKKNIFLTIENSFKQLQLYKDSLQVTAPVVRISMNDLAKFNLSLKTKKDAPTGDFNETLKFKVENFYKTFDAGEIDIEITYKKSILQTALQNLTLSPLNSSFQITEEHLNFISIAPNIEPKNINFTIQSPPSGLHIAKDSVFANPSDSWSMEDIKNNSIFLLHSLSDGGQGIFKLKVSDGHSEIEIDWMIQIEAAPVNPWFVDDDLDGMSEAEGDCNDNNKDIYFGAPESCDLVDSNCNLNIVDHFGDHDLDSLPDCLDPDPDNDGMNNTDDDGNPLDQCPLGSIHWTSISFGASPTDRDEDGCKDDGEDLDDDNDGVLDINDSCPLLHHQGVDTDHNGCHDSLDDLDLDGSIGMNDCNDRDPYNWISCSSCLDIDNDGFFVGCDTYHFENKKGPDCNDSLSQVYPGAPEIPGNGIDEDCLAGDAIGASETDIFIDANQSLELCEAKGRNSRDGSQEKPYCDSLDAIAAMTETKHKLFFTRGEYSHFSVINKHLKVYGGYDSNWNYHALNLQASNYNSLNSTVFAKHDPAQSSRYGSFFSSLEPVRSHSVHIFNAVFKLDFAEHSLAANNGRALWVDSADRIIIDQSVFINEPPIAPITLASSHNLALLTVQGEPHRAEISASRFELTDLAADGENKALDLSLVDLKSAYQTYFYNNSLLVNQIELTGPGSKLSSFALLKIGTQEPSSTVIDHNDFKLGEGGVFALKATAVSLEHEYLSVISIDNNHANSYQHIANNQIAITGLSDELGAFAAFSVRNNTEFDSSLTLLKKNHLQMMQPSKGCSAELSKQSAVQAISAQLWMIGNEFEAQSGPCQFTAAKFKDAAGETPPAGLWVLHSNRFTPSFAHVAQKADDDLINSISFDAEGLLTTSNNGFYPLSESHNLNTEATPTAFSLDLFLEMIEDPRDNANKPMHQIFGFTQELAQQFWQQTN